MPAYVYSTLTCDNEYASWIKNGDQQSIERKVLIKGGHGVMNKHFITPLGVVTDVSDEDLEFLEGIDAFQQHKKNGFITVEKKKIDAEKAAANMKRRDQSAPITPADYAPGGMMDGVKEPTVTGVN
jgi:hypothetical protein